MFISQTLDTKYRSWFVGSVLFEISPYGSERYFSPSINQTFNIDPDTGLEKSSLGNIYQEVQTKTYKQNTVYFDFYGDGVPIACDSGYYDAYAVSKTVVRFKECCIAECFGIPLEFERLYDLN